MEYEDAYKIIESGKYIRKIKMTKEEARIELLKILYQFSIRVYTKKADILISEMIRDFKIV